MKDNDSVDPLNLAVVLSDEAYVSSLGVDDAADLIQMAQYVSAGNSAYCTETLGKVVFERLVNYDEEATDYRIKNFYALVAVSLAQNPYMSRDVENWAFEQVERVGNRADVPQGGWAANLLVSLAGLEREGDFSQWRYQFERRLALAIRQFYWLQYELTDYKMVGVKNVLNHKNQEILLQLFAQANSFFATKDDDGFFKQMISTGALNSVFRYMASSENSVSERFSDTAEDFYLRAPVPGTDGKGHFAKSLNGRRHAVLANLVHALLLSYSTHGAEENSKLSQEFVRGYLRTNKDGHFVDYLYIPLQGMRIASATNYFTSLTGWEKEEAALQNELYNKLRKGYPSMVACVGLQGACEVVVEWAGLGKIFGAIGKGAKVGSRAVGKQITKAMPPRALMYTGLAQLAARQGKKAVVRWSKQTIKKLLQSGGWKGGVSTAARKTTPKRRSVR